MLRISWGDVEKKKKILICWVSQLILDSNIIFELNNVREILNHIISRIKNSLLKDKTKYSLLLKRYWESHLFRDVDKEKEDLIIHRITQLILLILFL